MKKLLAGALALAALMAGSLAHAETAVGYTDQLNNHPVVIPVTPSKPLPTAPQYGASGVAPVAPALTSATCTSAFTPIAGRGFNVSGWGTFVATYELDRSFDGGTTKLPITAAGTQLYSWTVPASEQAQETESGVSYYVCVKSYTSGTLNIRISQ